jgi:ABC-type uncharacterized transport system ATPase subunit
VDEIKHNFAGNAVSVECQGDFAGFAPTIPGILETRQENGVYHLTLAAGTDPQAVLRALVSRDGLKIQSFELAEPSLDDIFVSVVQGNHGR